MMIRNMRSWQVPSRVSAVALACAAVLIVGACGGTSADTSAGSPAGDPVAGGSARVLYIHEPRSLDPAAMSNAWTMTAFLGNALYGTLMINDPKTGEIEFKLAEAFTTSDGGATFELKLRPGSTFSDGSPLDAEAVKVNWDRTKDPANGSANIQEASMVASSKVVDATTLEVTMVAPVQNYAQAVASSTMNWIASPKALKAGQRAFDANPVGAGPYTLKKWTRQDSIELVKNPKYWDAPKPYLESITLRPATDTAQRINTLISGAADVVIDTNLANVAKAREAGFGAHVLSLNGGQYLGFNTRRKPFDDVRARKAVAAALDLDALNAAVYNGKAQIPRTLFTKSSPFSSDTEFPKQDKETAQKLFDELAAEGKPVSFTFTSYAAPENKALAEAVQAQLSSFRNAEAKVKVVDSADAGKLVATHDFDMIVSSALFVDPEPRLWTVFNGDSRGNMSGIDDEQLNAALQTGRTATDTTEREAAYQAVQERLNELTPVVFYTSGSPAAMTAKNVHGVLQYGLGSLLPEELWIQK